MACVIVQHPNRYGILEPVRELFGAAHDGGAVAIQVFDPLSLGVLAPPGELGADIAVAEGQSLGNHLSFGGPYLGVIATRMDLLRRLPGRIVGRTVDVEGRTGYVLTLQAREQHIRREKATSNICTSQPLWRSRPRSTSPGWARAAWSSSAEPVTRRPHYAAERLARIPGVALRFPEAPFFKEFALRLPRRADEVRR
ncbi:MAG: hypothetical protein KatS3mg014_1358 [Actinomycetota bacterium]|nr:MAG: hypothetical protein KatS3mg014_1358 [Actinomycetota bacterium]